MTPDDPRERARGRRVLVVEDDYLIADDLRGQLERLGAVVVGPVPGVSAALDLIRSGEALDGATLDVSLGRERAFPVAAALRARGIPFVFVTGYDARSIPAEFSAVPRCNKPADVARLVCLLFGR